MEGGVYKRNCPTKNPNLLEQAKLHHGTSGLIQRGSSREVAGAEANIEALHSTIQEVLRTRWE